MRILIDGWLLSTAYKHRSQGLRFRRLCQQIVWDDQAHEWFVCVDNVDDPRDGQLSFEPYVTVLPISAANVGHDLVDRDDRYRREIQRIVDQNAIDLYWHPAATSLEVPVPVGLDRVDVCLSVDGAESLEWQGASRSDSMPALAREIQQRRIEALPSWADSLCFGTQAARDVFVTHVNQANRDRSTNAVVIPPSLNDFSRRVRHGQTSDADSPRLLFGQELPSESELRTVGKLLSDISTLHGESQRLTLVAVGHFGRLARERLVHTWNPGIDQTIVLETYGTIDGMNAAGHACDAMVVGPQGAVDLELLSIALADGLPLVVPRSWCLRELIDVAPHFYTPGDPDSVMTALASVLDRTIGETRNRTLNCRATNHSWDTTAAAHVAWFERFGRARVDVKPRPLRIAYASPWPPQRTGVADYSVSLAKQLAEHVDVTVFTEAKVSHDAPRENISVRPLNSLNALHEQFDAVVYHLGNNVEFHRALYMQAWQRPGVVVIHDINIHGFLSGAFLGSKEEYLYFDAVEQGYGISRGQFEPETLDLFDYPMSRAIAERSLATVVHNRWSREQLEGIDSVHLIPHGAVSSCRSCDPGLMARLRRRLAIGSQEFVVSTMGFVNRLKRVPVIVRAISHLRRMGYPVRLIVGGSLTDEQDWLVELIAKLQMEDAVTITGYLSDDEFDGVIQLSDVVLNLRFPSMGESSGTMYKAMARSKACIVSNYAQFAELPDDACWKIDVDDHEVSQLVAALTELLRDSNLRRTLALNAKRFVERFSSYELSARLYADVLAKVVATEGTLASGNCLRNTA